MSKSPIDNDKGSSQPDVLRRISVSGPYSSVEKKIATYIESHYPHSVMESIQELSTNSGVSIASVSRFIQRLKYENFSEFRKEAHIILNKRMNSPIARYDIAHDKSINNITILKKHFTACIANLEETLSRIDEKEFDTAVKTLVSANAVYVIGGSSAQALAKYFVIFAKYIRKNVYYLDPDITTLSHNLSDMTNDDVLLAISHFRCSKVTTKVSKLFHKKGAKVVVVSDTQSNPISPFADSSLIVRSSSGSLFNSRAVTLALLEAIINGMVGYSQDDVKNRFAAMEEVFELFDLF